MVRRNVFEGVLKEKMVCHEVVGGGRAAFHHMSDAFAVKRRTDTYFRRHQWKEGGSY